MFAGYVVTRSRPYLLRLLLEQREEGREVGVRIIGRRVVVYEDTCVPEEAGGFIGLLAVPGCELPDDPTEHVEGAIAQAFRGEGFKMFPEGFGRYSRDGLRPVRSPLVATDLRAGQRQLLEVCQEGDGLVFRTVKGERGLALGGHGGFLNFNITGRQTHFRPSGLYLGGGEPRLR